MIVEIVASPPWEAVVQRPVWRHQSWMRAALAILLFAAIASWPSVRLGATDYSKMFEPPYARLHLLSGKRVQQMECAGLALHLRDARPGFRKAVAERLSGAVTRRVAAELGSDEVAREFVEAKAYNHSSPFHSAEDRAKTTAMIEGQCQPLFAEAAKGDVELDAILGPVPSKPLELSDPGQCLAVMTYAAERGAIDIAQETKGPLRKIWIDDAPEGEKVTRKAKLATSISMLRSIAPGEDQLFGMFATCAPTLKDVMAKHMDGKLR